MNNAKHLRYALSDIVDAVGKAFRHYYQLKSGDNVAREYADLFEDAAVEELRNCIENIFRVMDRYPLEDTDE